MIIVCSRGCGALANGDDSVGRVQGDILMSPMQTVYRHMDALPWDLSDVLADVAQQDLDGRRRAVNPLDSFFGSIDHLCGRVRKTTALA